MKYERGMFTERRRGESKLKVNKIHKDLRAKEKYQLNFGRFMKRPLKGEKRRLHIKDQRPTFHKLPKVRY